MCVNLGLLWLWARLWEEFSLYIPLSYIFTQRPAYSAKWVISSCIYFLANSTSFLFMDELRSLSMYLILTIHSSRWQTPRVVWITQCMCTYLSLVIHSSTDRHLQVVQLGHMVVLVLVSWRSIILISAEAGLSSILTRNITRILISPHPCQHLLLLFL